MGVAVLGAMPMPCPAPLAVRVCLASAGKRSDGRRGRAVSEPGLCYLPPWHAVAQRSTGWRARWACYWHVESKYNIN